MTAEYFLSGKRTTQAPKATTKTLNININSPDLPNGTATSAWYESMSTHRSLR